MTEDRGPLHVVPGPDDNGDREDRARNRIFSLLGRADELPPGTVVFDLWAALDQLIDPMHPPTPPTSSWIEDAVQAMRDVLADLRRAEVLAGNPRDATRYRNAADHITNALADFPR